MSKSAVTHALRDFIVNSATTSSSFYQTRESIKNFYLTSYMRKMSVFQFNHEQYKSFLRASIHSHFAGDDTGSDGNTRSSNMNSSSISNYRVTTGALPVVDRALRYDQHDNSEQGNDYFGFSNNFPNNSSGTNNNSNNNYNYNYNSSSSSCSSSSSSSSSNLFGCHFVCYLNYNNHFYSYNGMLFDGALQ